VFTHGEPPRLKLRWHPHLRDIYGGADLDVYSREPAAGLALMASSNPSLPWWAVGMSPGAFAAVSAVFAFTNHPAEHVSLSPAHRSETPASGCGSSIFAVFGTVPHQRQQPQREDPSRPIEALPGRPSPIGHGNHPSGGGVGPEAELEPNQQEGLFGLRLFLGGKKGFLAPAGVGEHAVGLLPPAIRPIPPTTSLLRRPANRSGAVVGTPSRLGFQRSAQAVSGNATTPPMAMAHGP